VQAILNTGQYPIGIRFTDNDVATLPLARHDFHGDWNYTLNSPDTP
jgi:hypothetical protein